MTMMFANPPEFIYKDNLSPNSPDQLQAYYCIDGARHSLYWTQFVLWCDALKSSESSEHSHGGYTVELETTLTEILADLPHWSVDNSALEFRKDSRNPNCDNFELLSTSMGLNRFF